MTLLWLAALLTAAAWVQLTPTAGEPHRALAWLQLIVAAVAAAAALRRCSRPVPVWIRLLLIASGAAAILALPFPYSVGCVVLAAFAVLGWSPTFERHTSVRWSALAAGCVGIALTVLTAFTPAYRMVAARIHDLGPLTLPLAWALRRLGQPASADPPYVHVHAVGAVATVDVSVEKLGGYPLACFLTVAVLLVLLRYGRRCGRALLTLAGLAALYAALRFLLLTLVQQGAPAPEVFFDRGWDLWGLTVLATFCALALRAPLSGASSTEAPAAATQARTAAPARSRAATLAWLCAALGTALVVAYGFQDPGRVKRGRVMIDEAHSNWEWSTIGFDTVSYGVQTVYNYSELMRLFGHCYDAITNFDSLTTGVLEQTDVLILKTPTRPYADAEVDAIERFVANGGGLWLVGDHTNIFGMSSNLNRVARRFGMRYNYDAVIDLITRGRQLYDHPRLLAHPAVINLPPLLLATSCSMQAPFSARDVMIGQSLLADQLDYSVNTFFGNFAPDPFEPFGTILQSAAALHGKGRVLLFTDSTIFSNFFMFIQGKAELALGSVSWLMRENRLAWVAKLALACAVLLGLATLAMAWRTDRFLALATAAGSGGLAVIVSALLLTVHTRHCYPLPTPRTALPTIAFERGHCSYGLPEERELPDNSPQSHQTFYVWTERVGYMPFTAPLADCLRRARLLVLVNPRAAIDAQGRADLERWVHDGGRLLVLDSPHVSHVHVHVHGQEHMEQTGTSANELLAPFGIRMMGAELDSVVALSPATRDTVAMLHHVGAVTGGVPRLIRPDGTPILVVAEHGQGKVAALCASDSFTDAVLGTTSQLPSKSQLDLYRIEFSLLDDVLRPPDVPRPVPPPPPARAAPSSAKGSP